MPVYYGVLTGRYHRQTLLPQIGEAGQARLAASRLVLIGCGALGTVFAEVLARAGVGHLILCDRDLVEPSNLQRQTLFTEADAADSRPKALAAAERLREVNGDIRIESKTIDVTAENVESLIAGADLVLDGTDNAQTRYLVNDACVKQAIPWIYGAAIATEGRMMPVLPDTGPCLRCVFPEPPDPGELPTCDTAGVLASATGTVANLQAAMAIRLLSGDPPPLLLHVIDVWAGRFQSVDVSQARSPGCTCCGRREFEFLDAPAADSAQLCGQDSVQIRLPSAHFDLEAIAIKLSSLGEVRRIGPMLRVTPNERPHLRLSVFPDARIIVQGTHDIAEARSLYARFIGV